LGEKKGKKGGRRADNLNHLFFGLQGGLKRVRGKEEGGGRKSFPTIYIRGVKKIRRKEKEQKKEDVLFPLTSFQGERSAGR